MVDLEIGRFSRTKDKLELIHKENIPYLIKKINLRTLHGKYSPRLFYGQILEYIHQIKQANVPLPEIVEHSIIGDTIIFTCRHHGDNFMQIIKHPRELFNSLLPKTKEVITILKQFQDAKLPMDPHLKNFVIDSDKVYYIDFSPPYGPHYNPVILNAIPDIHKDMVSKNLDYFNPDKIGFHLAGDLLKEGSQYEEIMPQLFKLLSESGVVNTSYQQFLKYANEIKNIELKRAQTEWRLS